MDKLPEIHIVAGFLGAGKTTFLNSYLPLLAGNTVVIENEAGTQGVDGDLLGNDIPVRELSAGCICCTLAPKLHAQLEEITEAFSPDQIVIEPSGVGNLSDIVKHCKSFGYEPCVQIVMVDAQEFEDYSENFGTFYMDQIDNASLIFLTHLDDVGTKELDDVTAKIEQSNDRALIVDSDWRELAGKELLNIVEQTKCELEILEHEHHHDHDFENNGFSQILFRNLRVWDNSYFDKVVSELNSGKYGDIFRAKGFVLTQNEAVKYFDFTPSYQELTDMSDSIKKDSLRLVVIGQNLDGELLEELLCKNI